MGFKPNIRKNIYIASDIHKQISEALLSPLSLSNQYLGIRNVHQGTFGKRTGIFPSRKNSGAIAVESQLELGHVIELERAQSILSYRSQSIKIILDDNTFAFPDFLVLNIFNSYEIHEVKESLAALSKAQIEKFTLIKSYLERKNIIYKLYDKDQIPTHKQRQNLLWMYQTSINTRITPEEISIAQTISIPHFIQFHKIHSFLKEYNFSPEQVNYLLFYKYIGKNRFPEINLLGSLS